ncbi:hypothetical protein CPB85DRAFT_257078 [Mucidula mucida]|nr:hypothetical protein CPB85DRAFT_257078 [Mucidula mucida]
MTNGGDLPWEITELIFSHLALNALRNVSLASRAFRAETRKYMYQSLTITINVTRDVILHFLKTSERPDKVYAQQRLAFFKSEPISDYVRACSVDYVTKDIEFDSIIDDFCAHLPNFPRLTELSFRRVSIDERRAENISRCRSLQSLSFTYCHAPSAIPSNLRHTVSTHSLFLSRDDNTPNLPPQQWLSLINLDTLTRLQLETQSSALDALEELTSFGATSLKSIALSGDNSVMKSDLLPVALGKCPHLSKLKVLTASRGVTLVPLPESVSLSAFDGPQDMLKSVVETQKRLRRVRLNGTRWGGTCDRFDIQQQLHDLQACAPDLEAMQLRAFPTKALCTSITHLFLKLRSLSFELPLQTQREEPMYALTYEPFFEALLSMTLPGDLENLVILFMIASNPIEGQKIIETRLLDGLDRVPATDGYS